MNVDMSGKSFVKLLDFNRDEIRYLLDLSASLKKAKRERTEQKQLTGRNIALVFEKPSTRTRSSFEVAAADQGASTVYLGPSGSHFGAKETAKDSARVLGEFFDAIQYRGFAQKTVETLREFSGVPVWNGLTDTFHPTQILGDFLTMQETSAKRLEEMTICFLGDAQNNVANSLMIGGAKMGVTVRLVGPKERMPDEEIRSKAALLAKEQGGAIEFYADPAEGVEGADFLYTDVWLSMGEDEEQWKQRIDLLQPYQINKRLMERTGKDTKFMHCLPAFHNTETKIGKRVYDKFGLDAMEVTDEVFESDASVVFRQAGNRLHTIKAVMVATLAEERDS